MKKRNLRSLNLNKKSISSLQQDEVSGGTISSAFLIALTDMSKGWCPSDTCISTVYDGPVNETCANCQ